MAATLISIFLPLLLLFQAHTSTSASTSMVVNDITFVVEPKDYRAGGEFTLICTISITPVESHFNLDFIHNGTTIGSYVVLDGEINRWVPKSAYITESSSLYPTFTAKILPRANTSGEYKCSIGYNEVSLFNFKPYTADSKTWSTGGGQWRAELHCAFFAAFVACQMIAGNWW